MQALFSETKINGMILSNRFVRSATWSAMATEDGSCTSHLVNLMIKLTDGGVGLIITGHAYVRKDGQAGVNQIGVYCDDHAAGLRDMVKKVHNHGGKIVLQISHAGLFANSKLTGTTAVSPSVPEGLVRANRKEMSYTDIEELINAFEAAAMRAKAAGFDGVQIHAAHGYLLSQFLSPVLNHRTDAYGGDIKNRARFLLEVFQAIRGAVGRDYPIFVKLNCQDFVDGGLLLEDSLQVGCMLADQGIDAIEISGGLPASGGLGPIRKGITSEGREAYFKDEARKFKKKVSVPVILVGGIRSFQVAKGLVEDGVADYLSMSRPFIREPDLINRWKSGDLRKSTCISENSCLKAARSGSAIYCVTDKMQQDS